MSLASIRSAIVTGLATIPGLRVHDHVPDSFAEFPAVAVRLWAANYTDSTYTFRLLLVASGWNVAEAEVALHPFLERAGASSIRGVLNGDPNCITVAAGPVGRQLANGLPYMGVELTVVARDV
jgi:hypothetical protein